MMTFQRSVGQKIPKLYRNKSLKQIRPLSRPITGYDRPNKKEFVLYQRVDTITKSTSTCRRRSQAPQAHAAGLGSNTPAPLKDALNPSGVSTPTSLNHPQVRRPDHTRKSSCSSRTSGDLCTSTTSCCKTISPRLVCLLRRNVFAADVVWQKQNLGFIVLGPDYFFGTYIQDLPADHDKLAWAHEARAAANESFPKWLEAVKATYGKRLLRDVPPPPDPDSQVPRRQSTPRLVRVLA